MTLDIARRWAQSCERAWSCQASEAEQGWTWLGCVGENPRICQVDGASACLRRTWRGHRVRTGPVLVDRQPLRSGLRICQLWLALV
jgi:hypothetical protein